MYKISASYSVTLFPSIKFITLITCAKISVKELLGISEVPQNDLIPPPIPHFNAKGRVALPNRIFGPFRTMPHQKQCEQGA